MTYRVPYVGEGADGARRSAQIDREEADVLPPGEGRDLLLASAEAWDRQAREDQALESPDPEWFTDSTDDRVWPKGYGEHRG